MALVPESPRLSLIAGVADELTRWKRAIRAKFSIRFADIGRVVKVNGTSRLVALRATDASLLIGKHPASKAGKCRFESYGACVTERPRPAKPAARVGEIGC